MGLDTSHDCWHGAYSSFMRWRKKLSEVAGYGDLDKRAGFGGDLPWPSVEADVLVELLHHSDCDGEIHADLCGPLADRLETLLPALKIAGDGQGHIGTYEDKTKQFIVGLRLAASLKEPVNFH